MCLIPFKYILKIHDGKMDWAVSDKLLTEVEHILPKHSVRTVFLHNFIVIIYYINLNKCSFLKVKIYLHLSKH